MKLTQILIFILITFSCSSQDINCNRFHVGKFKNIDKNSGTTFITRDSTFQTEINNDIGYSVKLAINWENECSYKLRLIRILENKRNFPVDTTLVLTVQIIETKQESYRQKTTSNKSSIVYESEIILDK
jgi:hypothetical protein